ncbi:hypothetical protein FACS1894182_09980 [Bacteroidia bacterium]|nr:hypothetical protein FACS1894182_09980 [Bacteroidia bacterium]
METWFAEFTKYPYRDQLSVMFSFWKSGFTALKIIEGNVYNNQFIQENREKTMNNMLKSISLTKLKHFITIVPKC